MINRFQIIALCVLQFISMHRISVAGNALMHIDARVTCPRIVEGLQLGITSEYPNNVYTVHSVAANSNFFCNRTRSAI